MLRFFLASLCATALAVLPAHAESAFHQQPARTFMLTYPGYPHPDLHGLRGIYNPGPNQWLLFTQDAPYDEESNDCDNSDLTQLVADNDGPDYAPSDGLSSFTEMTRSLRGHSHVYVVFLKCAMRPDGTYSGAVCISSDEGGTTLDTCARATGRYVKP